MKRCPVSSWCLAVVLGFGALPVAHAGLISVAGAGGIISAPIAVGNSDNGDATRQQGFDEQQGAVVGLGGLAVDSGSIAAGTVVDSHMIFLNQPDGSGVNPTKTATWTFSGLVLGVMSDAGGTREAASNLLLGASGTTYPGAFTSRGLEGGGDGYTVLGSTLTVTMSVSQPGDWIRVVTQHVPDEGSVGILFGLGLVVLSALRRAAGGLK